MIHNFKYELLSLDFLVEIVVVLMQLFGPYVTVFHLFLVRLEICRKLDQLLLELRVHPLQLLLLALVL